MNKAVRAMSSAQDTHGGQAFPIIGLQATFMHRGAIILSLGYTYPGLYKAGGNPYGSFVTATGKPLRDEQRAAIGFQARRLVEFADKLASE